MTDAKTPDLVRAAAFRFRNKMVWTADDERFGKSDFWKDLYHDFMDANTDVVRCDCEDYAMSLQRYCMINLGLSPSKISLHMVSTKGENFLNHAIGSVNIDGISYFWDNAQREPFYSFLQLPSSYKLLTHSYYNRPQLWFETVGVKHL